MLNLLICQLKYKWTIGGSYLLFVFQKYARILLPLSFNRQLKLSPPKTTIYRQLIKFRPHYSNANSIKQKKDQPPSFVCNLCFEVHHPDDKNCTSCPSLKMKPVSCSQPDSTCTISRSTNIKTGNARQNHEEKKNYWC